jgi:hypothetical protein
MADRNAITQPQAGPEGFYRTSKAFGVTALPILAADLVAANTVQLFQVPKGFTAMRLYFAPSDMDTNGSPTLTLSLGDSGSAARLLSVFTGGQSGTSTSTIATTGVAFKFTADTNIQLTVGTGAATAAAGTVTVVLEGFMDNV